MQKLQKGSREQHTCQPFLQKIWIDEEDKMAAEINN
jgi:hypothetical protein